MGSLVACFFSNLGYSVDVYEMREDPRIESTTFTGKSINLALSERGRSALRVLGVEEEIIERHAIPMRGRMIHDLGPPASPDKGKMRIIPYDSQGRCIYSVSRRFLNQTLLSVAEKDPRVRLHFHHKLLSVNFEEGKSEFLVTDSDATEKKTLVTNVVIGADGAYSTIRKSLMKVSRINYNQEYIDHGYIELSIPAKEDGDFKMPPNFLHIWPRDEFMMIALPNQDRSFTVTLFMPFDWFDSMKTPELLISFFGKYFPDSLDLIGRDNLIRDFFSTAPSSLISVKCYPLHYEGKGLLIGDAAHAMVPFFGQGMNCGFEDCLVLWELICDSRLTKAIRIDHPSESSNGSIQGSKKSHEKTQSVQEDDLDSIFQLFQRKRSDDIKIICDLAMGNYIEMRHDVNSWSFLARKHLDHGMNRLFPSSWLSLYQMVTFSRLPYSEVVKKRRWQDKILKVSGGILGGGLLLAVVVIGTKLSFGSGR